MSGVAFGRRLTAFIPPAIGPRDKVAPVYLLFLDESGTHGDARVFILGGVAVHEHDAFHLAQRLEGALTYRLAPLGLDATKFELHAKDMKRGAHEWDAVPQKQRLTILGSVYRSIASYKCVDREFPCSLFAAIIDRRYENYEERAYELVLNRVRHDVGVDLSKASHT